MKVKFTFLTFLLCFSAQLFSQQPKVKTGGISVVPKKQQGTGKTNTTSGSKEHRSSKENSSLKNTTIDKTSYGPLTGVWRGYFTSGMGFFQERYKYEIQLGQNNNNGMKGVTYSYKTTVFYGKANLSGVYTPSTKNLVIKETKLVEVKMTNLDGGACLMTCYLEYSKIGGVEILEGTYTSVSLKDDNNGCGSGKVYLEKVPESDFYKEPFVTEHENNKKKTSTATVNSSPKPKEKVVVKPKTDVVTKPKTNNKPRIIPPVKKTEQPKQKIDPPVVKINPPPVKHKDDDAEEPKAEKKKPTPKVIKERENSLVKTLTVDEGEILISLYDNGQIDNDTITVFDNNQPVVWKKKLSDKPLCIKIKVDPENPYHELTMVAENLGEIPPNTSLMVVTAGNKRYELFLTSTEQKNSVVVIELKGSKKDLK